MDVPRLWDAGHYNPNSSGDEIFYSDCRGLSDQYYIYAQFAYQNQWGDDDYYTSPSSSISISTESTYNWSLGYSGGLNLIFSGWCLYKSGQSSVKFMKSSSPWVLTISDFYTISEYTTIFPLFYRTSDTYRVTFDMQGGSGGQVYTYIKCGQSMYMSDIPYKVGCIFQGYYSETNGRGTKYIDNRGQPVNSINLSKDTALYAYYKINDSTKPVIHRTTYEVDKGSGYYAYAYVTDNVGVNRVQFPTWTEYNGQDDLISDWQTNSSASGTLGSWTINGEVYNYRYYVARSAHNNEDGPYTTHIYAFDDAGNFVVSPIENVYLNLWEDYASTSYASGNGTESSPYIIKTPAELAKLAKDSRSSNLSGKCYKLGANIDLSGHIWNGISVDDGGDMWQEAFRGVFDGDMYTISNIETSGDYFITVYSGLFKSCLGTIKNVIIKNGNVYGKSYAGAIAGRGGHGSIYNCIVDNVDVKCDNNAAGGIYGAFDHTGGEIYSCVYQNGSVTGYGNAGGMVGWLNSNAKVYDCAVINATISAVNHETTKLVVGDNNQGGTLTSSYGQGTVNATATKQMYGDSRVWGNWSYSPLLNGGYPVQKTLFAIGGFSGSQNVYNYLTGTLKFSVE